MGHPRTLSPDEEDRLDRSYREGGLAVLAPPVVHYDHPDCPHSGCGHRLEWIDFHLDRLGDPGSVEPLIRAWWGGTGFAGRCPGCGGWIQFTTLGLSALADDAAQPLPRLPANWADVAQFA